MLFLRWLRYRKKCFGQISGCINEENMTAGTEGKTLFVLDENFTCLNFDGGGWGCQDVAITRQPDWPLLHVFLLPGPMTFEILQPSSTASSGLLRTSTISSGFCHGFLWFRLFVSTSCPAPFFRFPGSTQSLKYLFSVQALVRMLIRAVYELINIK